MNSILSWKFCFSGSTKSDDAWFEDAIPLTWTQWESQGQDPEFPKPNPSDEWLQECVEWMGGSGDLQDGDLDGEPCGLTHFLTCLLMIFNLHSVSCFHSRCCYFQYSFLYLSVGPQTKVMNMKTLPRLRGLMNGAVPIAPDLKTELLELFNNKKYSRRLVMSCHVLRGSPC